jgi:stage V sporulation protein AC
MEPFDGYDKAAARNIEKTYSAYILKSMPKTKLFSGCIRAFFTGGLICAIGQGLVVLGGAALKMKPQDARSFASICLIFIGALLTGIGIFDDIGRFSGAGSVVPITGFANGIAAAGIEHKREGLVLGIGINLFKIAGPVIVCGLSASVLYGLIYFLVTR